MSNVIGISFGSAFSCISIPGKQAPEIIANEDGDRMIPSVVAFTGYEEMCGTQAKQQALRNPTGTIHEFRQLLGRKINHPAVQQHSKTYRVPIVSAAEVPMYETDLYETEDAEEPIKQQHSVTEVTGKYLSKLKETAEYFIGSTVDGCVISIPAHFDKHQKDALLAATKLAGFSAAFPLHEPVAAAMAFQQSVTGTEHNDKLDQKLLVLDLGAHSLNMTLLSSHDGHYTIEESVDEQNLGGLSFDHVLAEFAKQEFKRKTKMDISDNKRAVTKLLNACERTKRSLTRQDSAPISVESLHEGIDFHASVPRGRFEMLSEPLYVRARNAINKVLEHAKLTAADIDQVLLVGGAGRMPRFIQTISNMFPESAVRSDIDPDEAISLGCSFQGQLLADNSIALDVEFAPAVLNANHISKTIGIQGPNGIIPLIPAGSPLPVRRAFTFPLAAKQTSVHLGLLEASTPLADVVLTGLDAGITNGSVEAVLLIEADHILQVTLTEKTSGETVTVKV